MPVQKLRLIISPYHAGILNHRVGAGPGRLIDDGLIQRLESIGVTVESYEIGLVYDFEGDIGRSFEVIRRISKAVKDAVKDGAFPIVLAGNCNSTVGVTAALPKEDLEIFWFDAHPDLATPDDTTSGYFDGMGVTTIIGKCWKALAATVAGFKPLELQQIFFVGVRDMSVNQRRLLNEIPDRVIYGGTEAPNDYAANIAKRLEEKRKSPCILHIDVDCLDTSVGLANEYAAPGGLKEADFLACVELVAEYRQPIALTVASFNPQLKGNDKIAEIALETILKVVQLL